MNNTTFVTSLFDSTDNPIQLARLGSYLESAEKLFSLDANFVMYLSPRLYPLFYRVAKKPVYFIPMDSWDLPTFNQIEQIIQSRRARNYYPHPRNTPQHQAICCAKPWMVANASKVNPYDSTHFAWVDLGIDKTCRGATQSKIDGVKSWDGDRIRTGVLRIYPKTDLFNYNWFYQWGRPCLIGTAWVGPRDVVQKYSSVFMDTYADTCSRGYGHNDEQTMWEVHESHPEFYDLFPSDYGTVLSGLDHVSDADNVVDAVISARDAGRFDILAKLKQECLNDKSRLDPQYVEIIRSI